MDREIELNPWGYRIPSGGELRTIRYFLDLTQVEVAEGIGVSTETLRCWENEETHPDSDKLTDLLVFYREEYGKKKEN